MMDRNGNDEQTVVMFMGREKDRVTAPLREVESYWHALCGIDAVPLRSQIDPRGIEGALENAFLIERISPKMAKMRVAGSHLNDLLGMEVAGMPLSTLFAPADRDRLGDAVEALFADPAIIRLKLSAESGFARAALDGELLLMPLRSDMGDVSRAIGCLVTHGRIGRTPRRFQIIGVDTRPALSQVTAKTSAPQYLKTRTPKVIRHLAESEEVFKGKINSDNVSAKVSFLRIVVSNDE